MEGWRVPRRVEDSRRVLWEKGDDVGAAWPFPEDGFVTSPGLRPLASPLSPRQALRGLRRRPGLALLESAGEGAGFSLITSDPIAVVGAPAGSGADPFAELATVLRHRRSAPPPPGIPFAGGVIGYIGYEAGDHLELLPPAQPDDLGVPDAWFGIHDWALLWTPDFPGGCLAATPFPDARPGGPDRWFDEVEGWLAEGVGGAGSPDGMPETAEPRIPILPSLDRAGFMAGVERIREYILAGDLFQANLTRRISLPTGVDGVELYERLSAESPAPYGAFLQGDGFAVASISPESFLSLRGRGVETRPIKGTAPRGRDEAADLAYREGLRGSEKDRAENVMIVDLLRNDLSRVCEDDSVQVPRLVEVESHPTVHHLVSSVTGRLREGVGPVELLAATFPGGSITGAPKIRAMEILRELEPHRRHLYTGALGIFGFHGDAELSIAIRTAILRDGWAHYGTGGGITLASDPAQEWDETEAKAAAFLRAVGGAA